MTQELMEIYESLNFPSALVFHKALKKRGILSRLKDIENFVQSRSERQILAPPPKYEGNIVSTYENERWAADLISFVSRPVKNNESQYAYILLVQDIFSRYLYARPLVNVAQTTPAFEEILTEAEGRMTDADYKSPARLDTDGGSEFTSERFKSMIQRHNIEHHIKPKEDLNAISTLDAAIKNIKKALTRRVRRNDSDWLTELEAAIKGYNDSYHSGIKSEPNDISEHDVFALKKKAAEGLQENSELTAKRMEKLNTTGAFRVYLGKLDAPKHRADKAKWSQEIHEVNDFVAPGIVRDHDGKKFLTKLVKAVPKDSSEIAEPKEYESKGSAQTDAIRRRALEPYVAQILPMIAHQTNLGFVTQKAKRIPGFADELKKQHLDMKSFIQLFPRNFHLHDGKVSAIGPRRGPLDAFSARSKFGI